MRITNDGQEVVPTRRADLPDAETTRGQPHTETSKAAAAEAGRCPPSTAPDNPIARRRLILQAKFPATHDFLREQEVVGMRNLRVVVMVVVIGVAVIGVVKVVVVAVVRYKTLHWKGDRNRGSKKNILPTSAYQTSSRPILHHKYHPAPSSAPDEPNKLTIIHVHRSQPRCTARSVNISVSLAFTRFFFRHDLVLESRESSRGEAGTSSLLPDESREAEGEGSFGDTTTTTRCHDRHAHFKVYYLALTL
ncbi:hypothetical protein E2C01_017617 [Portunus trituberculatus]|uniref:Uncharacterized protein n=1 Tax=Portunus trituberculatus TaxID=210409 RepID=A0A5B7DU08_PORTR|nr:hypothetical protein [Portunus trituberculatus]